MAPTATHYQCPKRRWLRIVAFRWMNSISRLVLGLSRQRQAGIRVTFKLFEFSMRLHENDCLMLENDRWWPLLSVKVCLMRWLVVEISCSKISEPGELLIAPGRPNFSTPIWLSWEELEIVSRKTNSCTQWLSHTHNYLCIRSWPSNRPEWWISWWHDKRNAGVGKLAFLRWRPDPLPPAVWSIPFFLGFIYHLDSIKPTMLDWVAKCCRMP